MNLKNFFKPTISKIILFLILMVGLNYFIISSIQIVDARILTGIPLGFYPIGSFLQLEGATPPEVEFSYINFIIDIIFWYLISCIIISLYHKIRKD